MPSARGFFSDEQVTQIKAAIQSAEENTSGEIRVHIENHCKGGNPMICANKIFHKTGMHKTHLHNAVLFYLAVKDKQFAVMGDSGIHKNVPEGFWELVRDKMLDSFKQENFIQGLCEGITMTGKELKKYFPHGISDKNELPNEVLFGKE